MSLSAFKALDRAIAIVIMLSAFAWLSDRVGAFIWGETQLFNIIWFITLGLTGISAALSALGAADD